MTDPTIPYGRRIAVHRLGHFVPEKILYEFDGPRVFTMRTLDGEMLFAYSYSDLEASQLFLIVPFSEDQLKDLTLGRSTLLEALAQPWIWIAQISLRGEVLDVNSVLIDELPAGTLPKSGVYLYPDLQPLFSVKLLGKELTAERVPASVVKSGVDHAYKALKVLVERALRVTGAHGRPEDRFRRHYDLPTQRLAFGSFEIAFGAPVPDQQYAVDFDEGSPSDADAAVQKQISELLEKGATWLTEGLSPERLGADEVSRDDYHAILSALSSLAPPSKGLVERVEVSGNFRHNSSSVISLTRSDTVQIKKCLQTVPPAEVTVIKEGYVRELDLDLQSFTLRSHDGGMTLLTGWVADDLVADVQAAFTSGRQVRVIGTQTLANACEIQKIEPVDAQLIAGEPGPFPTLTSS